MSEWNWPLRHSRPWPSPRDVIEIVVHVTDGVSPASRLQTAYSWIYPFRDLLFVAGCPRILRKTGASESKTDDRVFRVKKNDLPWSDTVVRWRLLKMYLRNSFTEVDVLGVDVLPLLPRVGYRNDTPNLRRRPCHTLCITEPNFLPSSMWVSCSFFSFFIN